MQYKGILLNGLRQLQLLTKHYESNNIDRFTPQQLQKCNLQRWLPYNVTLDSRLFTDFDRCLLRKLEPLRYEKRRPPKGTLVNKISIFSSFDKKRLFL